MRHYDSDEVAENYHKTFTSGSESSETKRRAAARYNKFISRLKKGGHVLDAGCGTGRFVRYFMSSGLQVTGIDNSISMIRRAAEENPVAVFKVMDIRHLDFPKNHFDGVWNVATLLHLNEPGVRSAMREAMRVLKGEGTMFLATRTSDKNMRKIEGSTEGGKITVNYYSPHTLEEIMISSGFEIIEMSVEPDDFSRPFDYVYALAKPSASTSGH
ncbi:MAG: methyltransferase domain-containing protein [Candidatus Thermoplasmatota archaeon]|nr:methyltransferase domain-containing protein [Candidatus Thermoplasmatota archaeon]MCL5793863.1 methyltransferase domain-containing protein [Candidatus Thermoplasmatota archaeon]